ncbi:MAG: transcription antitermination protein NusB [Candidatus Gracilibacteria bacterium]|nr:transcription antitermination protein NusB [Candidatus Gracilibacteria bacterium]MDD2908291.1 transcription antitermination protein NusB [Candidatus Gracilibacteria bacterium]
MNQTIKKSRRKTRQCLFQALYSCVFLKEKFDKQFFLESFFDEGFEGFLDDEFFDEIFSGVQEKEKELIYLVKKFAPKFDIGSMSLVNLIPVFISSYEQLFLKCDTIPFKVSIDEALELTKIYSDDQGRILANGILNSIKDNKETLLKEFQDIKDAKTYFFNV